ncbi:AAA family ATPase [Sphingomonas arantia]|uniref:histidine kinase n=1 Tax=Sphingomonas arantia TaxID=1460676 RepID=A0ABW4U028_9SPHN
MHFDEEWLRSGRQSALPAGNGTRYRREDRASGETMIVACGPWEAAADIAALEHEFAIRDQLDAAWAMVPIARIRTGDGLSLVYDDRGSSSDGGRGQDRDIGAFLRGAEAAAGALDGMHRAGLIHRALCPARIVAHTDGTVRLTALGFCCPAHSDAPPPNRHEADMPYAAPESLRGVQPGGDVRSDLYALGIIFYERLTGRLPFTATTAAGWLHAHLAAEPPAPHRVRSDVPEAIGSVVMKLIAKDAADRYQSAAALVTDLQQCREAWDARGTIEPFALGTADAPLLNDRADAFVGREAETARLGQAFRRVATSGASEIVLIEGAAGVGKSALVRALAGAFEASAVNMVHGKCERLRTDIPNHALGQAVEALVTGVLARGDAEIARMGAVLIQALGGHGRLIVDLAPEIELLIGPTPALLDLPPLQAKARFHAALSNVFAAFAGRETPLLLFVDDVQWADDATAGFIEAFAASLPAHVLLVIAYRDAEPRAEAMVAAIRGVADQGIPALTELTIAPLGVEDVARLTGRVLGRIGNDADAFVAMLHERTTGNPFFVRQWLRALVDEGMLTYAPAQDHWIWNPARVAGHGQPEDVVALMIRRLQRLPAATRDLVGRAALIGGRIDDALLSRLMDADPDALHRHAAAAAEAGLLVRSGPGYAFPHDRVLDAAYGLTKVADRGRVHARIATIMLDVWSDALSEHVFDIASQVERADRDALPVAQATLFVETLIAAARRAKLAAAVDNAQAYVAKALELLGPDAWRDRPDMAYAASLLRAECLLANARLIDAERAIAVLLDHASRPIDRARAYRLRAILLTIQSKYEAAVAAALAGLALFDVDLPRHPTPVQLRTAYDIVGAKLGDRPIAALVELPTTTDIGVAVTMELLATLSSSFFIEDDLSFLHLAKMVELTLDHGLTPSSPTGLAWFGVYIARHYDAYADGRAYSEVALAIVERYDYSASRTSALVALDQVTPFTAPLSDALAHARAGAAVGISTGDLGMACYACNHIITDVIAIGEPLAQVERDIQDGFTLTRHVGYRDVEGIIAAQHGLVRALRDGDDPAAVAGPGEQRLADEDGRPISIPTIAWERLYAGMGEVYRGRYAAAAAWLGATEALIWSLIANINVADFHLFRSVALAHADGGARDVLPCLARDRDRLAGWAALNPPVFRSKMLIVEAEIARLNGDVPGAAARYDRAAAAALASGFSGEEALAHRLAGDLLATHDMASAARHHYRLSREAFRRLGAVAMAARLDDRAAVAPGAPGHQPVVALEQAQFDVATALASARAVAEEIVLDRLIETLMRQVLVHAAARTGLLILICDGVPMIEARVHVADGGVTFDRVSTGPTGDDIPIGLLNTVLRTRRSLVLDDAQHDRRFDPTTQAALAGRRSILCLPLMKQGDLIGLLYLENNLASGVFTPGLLTMLEIIAAQAAISITTATLYADLVEENRLRATTETSLRLARAELAKTSHLNVMANLAASIAHEINQPLAVIVSNAGAGLRWLRRAEPDIAEVQASLESIREDGLRAADIVKALRGLAKQIPVVLAPISIDTIITEVLKLAASEIDGRGVSVVTELEAGDECVAGDAVQLRQVVYNLVINAIEAMDAIPAVARRLTLASVRGGDSVTVTVADNGPGLDPAAVPRVFDAFYTTKDSGMGMGLAICRSIIAAHGGVLDVRSAAGAGTTFEFTVPLSAGSGTA